MWFPKSYAQSNMEYPLKHNMQYKTELFTLEQKGVCATAATNFHSYIITQIHVITRKNEGVK